MSLKTDDEIIVKFRNLRDSAQRRGIKFTISLKKLITLYETKTCTYTGIPLTLDNFSVDRVDTKKGYCDNNVVACDEKFNRKKANLTVQEIENMYNILVKYKHIKPKKKCKPKQKSTILQWLGLKFHIKYKSKLKESGRIGIQKVKS